MSRVRERQSFYVCHQRVIYNVSQKVGTRKFGDMSCQFFTKSSVTVSTNLELCSSSTSSEKKSSKTDKSHHIWWHSTRIHSPIRGDWKRETWHRETIEIVGID